MCACKLNTAPAFHWRVSGHHPEHRPHPHISVSSFLLFFFLQAGINLKWNRGSKAANKKKWEGKEAIYSWFQIHFLFLILSPTQKDQGGVGIVTLSFRAFGSD